MKSTKTEDMLLYGLKVKFGMPREESAAIVTYLIEDDQVLMIDYLMNHPNATHQEIMNEFGRLLKQRQELTKS